MGENIKDKIKELCVDGLVETAPHHKQWFFEEILRVLKYDIEKLKREAHKNLYDPEEIWESGVAP